MSQRNKSEPPMSWLQKLLDGQRLHIFDIGARGGIHCRWERFFSVIDVLGFEPDPIECDKLNNSTGTLPYRARYLPYALGRKNENDLKFFVCRQPGCSSIYEPNIPFIRDFPYCDWMEVKSVRSVSTTTLSDICGKECVRPDFIKVDTQGSELDILVGGLDYLKYAKMIEVEVEFNSQYQGQPLFHDIDKFMRDQGWTLLGLRRSYWRRKQGLDRGVDGSGGQLVHGDALYYNSRAISDLGSSSVEMVKFLIMLSAYRQNDFVLSILKSDHHELPGLSDVDRALLASRLLHVSCFPVKIVQNMLTWITWINHKTKRKWIDALQRGDSVEWHDPDFF